MSNTIITNYGDIGDKCKQGKQVVVFVNKNGSLSLDKNILQKIIDTNDYENSSVSVVHFDDAKSTNPTMGGDSTPQLNLTVDAFYDPDTVEPYDEGLQDEEMEGNEFCLVAFKNDHCYTPYNPSDQAKKENVQKPPISNAKKITVLEDTVISKGKMLLKPDLLRKAGITSHAHINLNRILTKSERTHEIISPDTKFPTSENVSFQNVFIHQSVNPDQTKLLQPIDKNVKKLLNRKLELRKSGSTESQHLGELINVQKPSENVTLSRSEREAERRRQKKSLIVKNEDVRLSDTCKNNTVLLNTKLSENEESKIDFLKNKSYSKKDRKSSSSALLNDMTSLFSTPDVIRRVSIDGKSNVKTANISSTIHDNMEKIHSDTRNIKNIKPETKTYSNVHLKSNQRNINKPQITDALSVFTALDDASLTNLLQQDPNTAILTDDISGHLEKHVNQANLILSPNTLNSGHINAPLSPGLDLLGGLQPEEAGLTEDLMMHVAQLVESSENLQEVIDKQVLGKVGDFHTVPTNIDVMQTHLPAPEVKSEPNIPTTPTQSSKEPIKIVRGNGRVITLPPIEAPATRSKRKSMLNTTMEAIPGDLNASLNKLTTPATQSAAIKEAGQGVVKRSHRAGDQPAILTKIDNAEAGESDGSWNSEDDPDRLWCVCKQPHNNRFMICCDMCEDWFHGKCVNVTKAMGQEMEESGIEWRCPNCVRKTKQPSGKPSHKSVPKRSPDIKSEETADSAPGLKSTGTSCIVCKKAARASSIYCSDACILKHAQESLPPAPPLKSPPGKDNVQNKPKLDQRVVVIDRASGKYLAGPSAPTAANLKNWLQEHPTYEVVRPANKVTPGGNVVKPKPKSDGPKVVQSVIKVTNDNQLGISPPTKNQQTSKTPSKPITSPQTNSKILSPKPILVKPGLKSPTSVKSPSTSAPKPVVTPKSPSTSQTKQPPIKSPTPQSSSTSYKKEESRRHSSSTTPIRDNVRKALEAQLTARMSESKDSKLTPEQIKRFAIDTEHELHELFKDVGAKYKAKYRSLAFNLKDRKNLTLWQKICDKSLTPKQLVRLSPEELASQELAQWRDKEVKHQLELIKKSELDLLACAKTYVLKTHKGEEVMESKTTDMTELDPNVSVEDLVSALNKSEAPAEEDSKPSSPVSHKHSSHTKNSSRRDSSSGHDKNRHSSKDGKSSRSHHRKSSRERDRHKRHDDRKTSSSSTGSHHKSKSKSSSSVYKSSSSRDKSRTRSRSKDRLKHRSTSKDGDFKGTEPDTEINIDEKLADSNILVATINEAIIESTELLKANESELEANAQNLANMPLWNGSISMVDVAKFNVAGYKIAGEVTDLKLCLNPDIEIVGRISPEIVWDYLNRTKKQGYKEIQVIKLLPSVSDDRLQFDIFYSYLESRNRLGVARVTGGVKDFYIWPMTMTTQVPEILSTVCGLTLEEPRVDLLIGIIVRQKRKRPSTQTSYAAPKISKISDPSEGSYTPPIVSSYTPPGSPKKSSHLSTNPGFIPSLASNVKDKIAATLAATDENEPYSPGGSDNSDDLSQIPGDLPNSSFVPDDLQRKVEEINRKIEEQKKAIESMSSTLPPGHTMDEEPYSPSRPMTPPINEEQIPTLSSISLPSNLQEILASIQKQTKSDAADSVQPEPYLPTPISHSIKSSYYGESSTTDVDMRIMHPASFIMPSVPPPPPSYVQSVKPSGGSLSSLSEEELLSMVPDGEILPPINKSSYHPPSSASRMPDTAYPPPPYKKSKMDYNQSSHIAPPGTED